MINFLYNKRGNTLVLSLILLIVMLAVTVGLSSAFVTELRLSKNLDEAVFSYYGAESGIEYGMYDARKTDLSLNKNDSGIFENDVEWTRDTKDFIEFLELVKISKDHSIQLDFYDHDDPAEASGVGSLAFSWEGAGSWALIKLTSWTLAASIDWATKFDEEKLYSNGVIEQCINLDNDKAYSIKIKALYSDMNNFELTAYDDLDCTSGTGAKVDILNFLDITGIGQYGNSKQAINVQIARGIPLSSLYNYVIFTEDSLIKTLP